MLFPAAVLVMLLFGAIAVDRAVVFGAQRDLIATAQAAANDGASFGVDIDNLRSGGSIQVDTQAMGRAVDLAALTAEPGTTYTWYIQGQDVVVEMEREVDLVFSPGVPGAPHTERVTARASAELRLSDP